MAIEKVLAGVAVGDFDSARDWYGRLLGRTPDAEPMGGLAEWHPSEHSGIQLIEDEGRAGSSLVTFVVDGLDERLAVLEAEGMPSGPIVGTPGLVRAVTVADPEGNLITFAGRTSPTRTERPTSTLVKRGSRILGSPTSP